MIRYRLYFDKDKETKWLNEMCNDGWAMSRFFAGLYVFQKCKPGEYTYQIDFGEKLFAVKEEYRELMDDIGVEIVQPWGYWIILRKLSSEGEFQLYTDVESKIEHYKKIRKMFKIAVVLEFMILCMEMLLTDFGQEPYTVPFLCLLAVVVLVLAQAAARTTDIINQLKEDNIGVKKRKNRSTWLILCLFLNSCVILIRESVPVHIVHYMQIIVIGFMLAAIWDMCRKKKD